MAIGYLPLMLLGVNGAAIHLAGSGAGKGALVALVLVAAAVSFAAERVAPYEPQWNRSRGDARRDVAHAIVNETLQGLSLLVLPVIVSLLAIDGVWPTSWPFVVQVVMTTVVVDAGITLGHWWSHRSTPLWRLHSVHHSVERFYGFNGLMKHPSTSCSRRPWQRPRSWSSGCDGGGGSGGGPCRRAAPGPTLQRGLRNGSLPPDPRGERRSRFHHLRWPGVGDVNFGLFFTVWDRLLGTYVCDPTSQFDSSVLGVAAEPDFPVAYWDQILHPFRPYRPQSVPVPDRWLA